MSIKGRLNQITDPLGFFTPILAGEGVPATGFAPFSGQAFTVALVGAIQVPEGGVVPISSVSTTASTVDGSFAFPTDPPAATLLALSLSLFGQPLYRSEFFPVNQSPVDAEIYLFQPTVPSSANFTAGQMSKLLAGHGLPGNTMLSTTPWGLSVSGSESQANLQFGIMITPDTSHDLGVYVDLALNGWNIHVGWPESWCKSADSILSEIRSGLQDSGSKSNQAVVDHVKQALEGPPFSLSEAVANDLLAAVSLQLSSLAFPITYAWPLSNQADTTAILVPQLVIGYPRFNPVLTAVPNLFQMSPAAATKLLHAAGLVPNFANHTGSWVSSQSPSAGQAVLPGSIVTMTLHAGPLQ
jgi:hypothetical protein